MSRSPVSRSSTGCDRYLIRAYLPSPQQLRHRRSASSPASPGKGRARVVRAQLQLITRSLSLAPLWPTTRDVGRLAQR
jgi:hypothetical protein